MRLRYLIPTLFLFLVVSLAESHSEKPRVLISSDIGGSDPDDFQSMVHYLVYADVFRTEGLVSSPPNGGRMSDILECLDAYEKDFPNLSSWSDHYPTPNGLRTITRQGAIDAQTGDVPCEAVSDGAERIIERCLADEPGPLYVLVWGSITDVAQAVHKEPGIKKKLRIYSIGSWNTRHDQKARDYLFDHHPDLWWIECDSTFRGMYMGGEQEGELGNTGFVEQNIAGHGNLGRLYVEKMGEIKMGDTPSVLYLLYGDIDDPASDHWGGAFIQPFPDTRPNYWHDNPDSSLSFNERNGAVTVNRWRGDYLRDWKSRMDRLRDKRPSSD